MLFARTLLFVVCLSCLGCASRSEQSVLLPPQTSAELLATGSRPILEVYNHGPATVETHLAAGDERHDKSLPPSVGWMLTLPGDGRIILTNTDEERRAIVDIIVERAEGLRFTQPVMPLNGASP
jgi:hypothetical protein